MSDLPLVRLANRKDAPILFKWRNLPEIIQYSTLKKKVTHDEHMKWFENCLGNPDVYRIFIVELQGDPAGSIRFQRDGSGAIVSIYLLQDYTGSGYGNTALLDSIEQISVCWPDLVRITADVLDSNEKAIRVFEKSGFEINDCGKLDGHKQLVLNINPG